MLCWCSHLLVPFQLLSPFCPLPPGYPSFEQRDKVSAHVHPCHPDEPRAKNCIKEGERKEKRKGRRQLLRKTKSDPQGPVGSYWNGTSTASYHSETVLSFSHRCFWQMWSIPRVSLHLNPLSSVNKEFWFMQAQADAHLLVPDGVFHPAPGVWGWTDLWEQTSKGGHITVS